MFLFDFKSLLDLLIMFSLVIGDTVEILLMLLSVNLEY